MMEQDLGEAANGSAMAENWLFSLKTSLLSFKLAVKKVCTIDPQILEPNLVHFKGKPI